MERKGLGFLASYVGPVNREGRLSGVWVRASWMRTVNQQLVRSVRSAETSHEDKDGCFQPVTDSASNKVGKNSYKQMQTLTPWVLYMIPKNL